MASRYPGPKPKVAILVYPDMVMVDLINPLTVFHILDFETHLVWKDTNPVATEINTPGGPKMTVAPTTTFADCPLDLDILCAPGGTIGTIALMNDIETLAFLVDRGSRAKWITGFCTGTLIMGAAGLFKGYRATTLWAVLDILPMFGATPVSERVVFDRNRVTGGGATAGMDFAFAIGARIRGEEEAKRAQLTIEYEPAPPFRAGTPKSAGPELTAKVKADRAGLDSMLLQSAQQAAARLG